MHIINNGGYGLAKVAGQRFSLGRIESPDLRQRFDHAMVQARLMGISPDRRLPRMGTMSELFAAYIAQIKVTHVKRGRPTGTVYTAERVKLLLEYAGLGQVTPAAFGPIHLRIFHEYLAGDPAQRWSLTTIRTYSKSVKAALGYGAECEIVPAEAIAQLDFTRKLCRGRVIVKGRPAPRAPRKVTAPDPASLERILLLGPPVLTAMIRVQMLAAMRPSEICAIRPMDLKFDDANQIWVYHVSAEVNKTEHEERDRTILLGPKAFTIIEHWLGGLAADEYIFSPHRAECMRRAVRRSERKHKLWPSHRMRKTKRNPERAAGDCYTTASYRRAITRLCKMHKVARWSPNQLRHAGCTVVANTLSLVAAKAVLGHADTRTTEGYIDNDHALAAEAMKKLG